MDAAVQPLGALIGEELMRVLERPVTLKYGRPSGRANPTLHPHSGLDK